MGSLSDYFYKLESATDMASLRSVGKEFLSGFGIEYFTLITIGLDGKAAMRNPFGTFDHEWPAMYVNRGHRPYDETLKRALAFNNELEPVRWSEVAKTMTLRELTVLREAESVGLSDGVIFSYHNQNGSVTHFTVAGSPFDIDDEAVAVLQRAGKRLHLRHQALLEFPERLEVPSLSGRQLDVLNLMNERKSANDIATILGMSVNTVKTHQKAILRKLEAISGEHALFNALRFSLMSQHHPEG